MEQWKDIPGFDGAYQASDAGRLRSTDRVITTKAGVQKKLIGRVLKTIPNGAGYQSLRLGRGHPVMVHQLVALTFIGEKPEGAYVCHNNGDKTDNRVDNLRYGTPASNQADRHIHGTAKFGSALPQAKLNEEKVRAIKDALGSATHEVLAKMFGVTRSAVSNIAIGKSWRHV